MEKCNLVETLANYHPKCVHEFDGFGEKVPPNCVDHLNLNNWHKYGHYILI